MKQLLIIMTIFLLSASIIGCTNPQTIDLTGKQSDNLSIELGKPIVTLAGVVIHYGGYIDKDTILITLDSTGSGNIQRALLLHSKYGIFTYTLKDYSIEISNLKINSDESITISLKGIAK